MMRVSSLLALVGAFLLSFVPQTADAYCTGGFRWGGSSPVAYTVVIPYKVHASICGIF